MLLCRNTEEFETKGQRFQRYFSIAVVLFGMLVSAIGKCYGQLKCCKYLKQVPYWLHGCLNKVYISHAKLLTINMSVLLCFYIVLMGHAFSLVLSLVCVQSGNTWLCYIPLYICNRLFHHTWINMAILWKGMFVHHASLAVA